jgi:hypothetical protein
MLSNFVFKVVPIAFTVAMITTEMPTAIRPYRSGARLIFQKRSDLGHVTGSLLVDVAMEVPVRSWNRLKPGRCN